MTPEDPEVVIQNIGRRIRELRRAKGLTQEQASVLLGLSVRGYRFLENGSQNFTVRTLVRVAGAFGATFADLTRPPTTRAKRGGPRKDDP